LEPFSLTINSDLGKHQYYARQFDQALSTHRKSLEMDQKFSRAHSELGYVLAQLKKPEDAIKEFQQALAVDKDRVDALAGLGFVYALSGDKKQAEQAIERLNELASRRYVSRYYFAVVYSGLGERAQALDDLEKAAEEHFNWLVFLKVDPVFDSLRSDPRFSALLQRMRL